MLQLTCIRQGEVTTMQQERLVYLPHNNFKRDGISYSEVYNYNGDNVEDYTCKNFLGYAPTDWCNRKGVEPLFKNRGSDRLYTSPICSRQAILDNVGCNRRQLELYLKDKRLSSIIQITKQQHIYFKNLGCKEIEILKKLHREHTAKHQ